MGIVLSKDNHKVSLKKNFSHFIVLSLYFGANIQHGEEILQQNLYFNDRSEVNLP